MGSYRQRQEEGRELAAASGSVTEGFMESLARLHFEADEGLEQVIWVKSCGDRQICLLEVNRTALPSESIQVFRFAPSEDVPFPMFVVDVRPTEWEQIQSEGIPLPEGWTLDEAMVFQRSEVILAEAEADDVG
jgi:hypothetical protein